MIEPEDYSDENGWGVLSDLLEDIRDQDFSGSAVLMIVGVILFAVYAPSVSRLLMAWINRHKVG